VFAAAELFQHRAGIGFVARFAEDEAIGFGNGVGGEDDRRGLGAGDWGRFTCRHKLLNHCGGFSIGEVGDEARRAEVAADATFDIFGRGYDDEVVARFRE
jgi:hypothetical protein